MSRLHADGYGFGGIAPGTPVAFTPVVTWAGNTIGVQAGLALKVSGWLFVWISFTETAGTASAILTITGLPSYSPAAIAAGTLTVGGMMNSVNGNSIAMVPSAGQINGIVATTGLVGTFSGVFVIPTVN